MKAENTFDFFKYTNDGLGVWEPLTEFPVSIFGADEDEEVSHIRLLNAAGYQAVTAYGQPEFGLAVFVTTAEKAMHLDYQFVCIFNYGEQWWAVFIPRLPDWLGFVNDVLPVLKHAPELEYDGAGQPG